MLTHHYSQALANGRKWKHFRSIDIEEEERDTVFIIYEQYDGASRKFK